MSAKHNPIGPAGRQVADSIARVRRDRQMSAQALGARLADLGRPKDRTAISRIEQGEHQINVDDLVMFAKALDVPPSALLTVLGEQCAICHGAPPAGLRCTTCCTEGRTA